jgi:hypothetical protein
LSNSNTANLQGIGTISIVNECRRSRKPGNVGFG